MRSGSAEATWSGTKARGAGMARTALLVLAFVAASFGVSQVLPGGAPAAAGVHSVALPVSVAVAAGGGSGEGPNR